MSAIGALRARRLEESSTKRIGVLFMIGSACFAIASIPGYASLSKEAAGITYFIGSLFFTTAAFEQLRTADGRAEFWSSVIQFAGTLLFNVNTFAALLNGFSARGEDFAVWLPDLVGSVCFLVASGIACAVVWRLPFFAHERRIARLNMIGSIFFMVSAVAAYVIPNTDELANAAWANLGTLIGALYFFWAAWLLVRAKPPAPDQVS